MTYLTTETKHARSGSHIALENSSTLDRNGIARSSKQMERTAPNCIADEAGPFQAVDLLIA